MQNCRVGATLQYRDAKVHRRQTATRGLTPGTCRPQGEIGGFRKWIWATCEEEEEEEEKEEKEKEEETNKLEGCREKEEREQEKEEEREKEEEKTAVDRGGATYYSLSGL